MEYIKFVNFIDSTQYGYTADTTSLVSGDAKYLRITDIVPYFVDKDRVPFCIIDASKVDKYLVHDGDVLIARTGATTGYNLVVDDSFKNYVFASYLIRFNYNRKKLYPRYLKYVLKSPSWYGFVNNYIGGSAQPGMNARVFGKYYLPYTDLSTQKKIASILSAYDSLIENNQKRIKLLEQMAENLYKEWFVRFRIPGYENARFDGGVPKGWKIVKLCEISTITDGVHNTIQDDPQGKYLLLSCKNIKDGRLVIGDNERTISEEVFLKLRKRTNLSKGDILLSSVGTIGEATLMTDNPSYYEFQRSVAIIKPNQGFVTSSFLYGVIKSMRREFENAAHGAAQQCLFLGDISRIKVMLPQQSLCVDFDRIVNPIYRAISSLEKQIKSLSTQRDLLLPRLMSGKLSI